MEQPFIEFRDVSKFFPGIVALDRVDADVFQGEVLGLVGENGAGKSTLIKLLTGNETHDEGKILVDGREMRFTSAQQSMKIGISAVYQELNIVPQLTVWENVYLGREMRDSRGFLDILRMKRRASEILRDLGQDIDVDSRVGGLGMGKKQMVEIAKALSLEVRLLILDEPTSSLSLREISELLQIVRNLKKKGITVIFISHRLEEILAICDRITVLRDGRVVATVAEKDATADALVKLMVGHEVGDYFPKVKAKMGEELLRVEDFCSQGVFSHIGFTLHRGEVLGFSGLVGAGRTEVFRALFGVDPKNCGRVFIRGKEVRIGNPREAIRHGIAFLTEDRRGEGLVLIDSIAYNISLSALLKYRKGPFLNVKKAQKAAVEYIQKLKIKTPSPSYPVNLLSGGNQQKVVIAKWINTDAEIFIFDEPTRGLDIGAKVEVYHVINQLTAAGKGVILISSEMPEVLGMSDRVLVMYEGKLTGEFRSEEAEQAAIMKAASGEMKA